MSIESPTTIISVSPYSSGKRMCYTANPAASNNSNYFTLLAAEQTQLHPHADLHITLSVVWIPNVAPWTKLQITIDITYTVRV